MKYSFVVSIAVGLGMLAAPQAASASPVIAITSHTSAGKPDTTFDEDGLSKVAMTECSEVAVRDAVVRNNQIFVTGRCSALLDWQGGSFVMRINPAGHRDQSFGYQGVELIRGIDAHAIAVDSSNRVVIAGRSSNDTFAIARLTALGALDPSFGDGGLKVTNVGGMTGEQIASVALQADGKIVVAGDGLSSTSGVGLVLAVGRYTSAGQLDSTFAGNGLTATNFTSSSQEVARSVIVAPDGKIVVAGYCQRDNQLLKQLMAARYTTTGALDTTLDGIGKVIVDWPTGGSVYAYAAGVDSQNRIVFGGVAWYGTPQFVVARLTKLGALDTSFGTGGTTHTDFSSSTSEAIADLLVLSSDKIVVAGDAEVDGSTRFAGAHYLANGLEDTKYDLDGKTLFNVPGGEEAGKAVAYDSVLQRTITVGEVY